MHVAVYVGAAVLNMHEMVFLRGDSYAACAHHRLGRLAHMLADDDVI
jgi:hypothetical protein